MRRFLRHFFLPHEANNQRARLLHNQTLLIIIAILVSISLFLPTVKKSSSSVLGDAINISATDLLQLTNQDRRQQGLPPLTINTQLSSAAELKAEDMFTKDYWAHNAPDGTTPWTFINKSGYHYVYAGENLARGFTSSSDVVSAWMDSPSHRENMLSVNYKDIGFAIKEGTLTGEDTILVVEMFGNTQQIVSSAQSSLPPPSFSEKPVEIASIQNNPLLDSSSLAWHIGIVLLLCFIGTLFTDFLITKRKNVFRLVGHNVDHILFLSMLLVMAFLLGKGVIL